MLELALTRKVGTYSGGVRDDSAFGAACKLFNVDLGAARKQVADEKAAKKPATAKPKKLAARAKKPATAALEARVRTCRACGCTEADCRQCIERTGEPCFWIARDLCSACAGEAD